MAKAPRAAKAPTPPAAPIAPAVAAAPVDTVMTDQINTALETITIEQLETPAEMPAAAPAPALIADEGMIWLELTTGLSGPDYALGPRDKHQFESAEAQRLIDAGFAVAI